MKILFLTVVTIEDVASPGIYTDLIREFRDRGEDMYVVCPRERRFRKRTEYATEKGIRFLRVRTGNITKTNFLEKGISTILIERQFIRAINRYLSDVRFDLVMYSAPPVTFEQAVRYVKRRDGCASYLILKDIFPQNAVDLGILRRGSLTWRYFRSKEKRLYAVSDYIGCMSPANVEYLLKHNPEIDPRRVEVCPNSIKPRPLRNLLEEKPTEMRDFYGIPHDALLLVYGGNLGQPQGISFLLRVLDAFKCREDVFFLIVGAGTEYGRIERHLQATEHKNVRLIPMMATEKYNKVLEECDVGLIFLDHRFTIPNFPSRLTGYMEAALPVLAATDESTDLKDVLRKSGCGVWVKSGDLNGFIAAVNHLSGDPAIRRKMGLNGRMYLEAHYTVSKTYDIIMSHFRR